MDIADLERKLGIDGISAEQQMEIISALQQSAAEKIAKAKSESIGKGAELVIQGLKKIKSDMEQKFAQLNGEIQSKVASIQNGQDGKDGKDGRDGRQGPAGATGATGRDGSPGRDGVDGANGVGVASARIDFDGSLVIVLDNGSEINAGEVVPFDIAERIKVITNGGGTSQYVLDTLASLQAQISAITGGLSYQGTWNASTNTPTLTSSVGVTNYYYIVGTSGSTNLNGITDWVAGDWLIFNGSVWQKIDQTNLVVSVNGQTGAVTLTTTNIAEGTNLYFTNALARGALSAGTAISYDSSTGVITNSSPDQTVSLTGSGTTTITGTYPNFTVASNDQFTGTVTSVSGTSPVASSGGNTPAISLSAGYGDTLNPYASKTANHVLAAPNGSAGVPTFRAVVAADIPTLNQNTTGTAASTPKLLTTNFTIEESGGKLLFKYGATTIASMSSTGVITSVTNIVANGTP